MYNVKLKTTLSKPESYEATSSGGSTRGLMVYTGLLIFFLHQVKPSDLSIETVEIADG